MADQDTQAQADPSRPTAELHRMLTEVVRRAREDVRTVREPRAQALMETTAEVCTGLATAYEHYQEQSEPAWR